MNNFSKMNNGGRPSIIFLIVRLTEEHQSFRWLFNVIITCDIIVK